MALNKGQRNLLLLAAVFFLPMIIAFIVIKNMPVGGGFATKNHGDLIRPAKPIKEVVLTNSNNSEFQVSSLRGKWVLVYLGTSVCNAGCADNLYKMRQARLGQKGEHNRIERLYISLDQDLDETVNSVLKEHPGLEVVSGNKSQLAKVLEQFATSEDEVRAEKIGLYILDPLGNLMMRYPQGYEAKGLAKDLEWLLKASQIG